MESLMRNTGKGIGFVVALLVALLLLALSAIAGGVSLGVTGAIIAAVLYFVGVVALGTAKAIFLWFFAAGAALGILRALVFGLIAGSS